MKSFHLLILSGLLFCWSCRKEGEPTPECIQSKISALADYSCEHGANVQEYLFQGNTVFVFSLGYCGADLPADVIDKNCNYMGFLGGFVGNTMINGEEFSDAKYVRTVWSR